MDNIFYKVDGWHWEKSLFSGLKSPPCPVTLFDWQDTPGPAGMLSQLGGSVLDTAPMLLCSPLHHLP